MRGGRVGAVLALAVLLAGAALPHPQQDDRVLAVGTVRILHAPADSLLADAVGAALTTTGPLPGLPGVVPRDLEVVLAPDADAFARATGGAPPHWSAGVAIPSEGRIVLPVWRGSELTRGSAREVIRHEWAHVAVYRGSGGLRPPRWFSEGYAEWAAGWDRTRAWRLRVLLAAGGVPSLDSLSFDWPAGRVPAETAYLLSASVVEYLVEASGPVGLETLFRHWRESGSFEQGLRRTYGVSSGQLEEDWRRWARGRYGWLFVLTHSSIAWGLLALLLAVTVVFRRRHQRERMARLRARELPETPAWWTPDPDGPPDGIFEEGGADTRGSSERSDDEGGP
ncbi:MAG: hypothetical protein RQ751_04300 [Longimicrobiales bacterium]|nr:hypothetical protein [Longimicrobiales bacterium]